MQLEGESRHVKVNKISLDPPSNLKSKLSGDSGGGFLYLDAHSSQWTILGIVSKGFSTNFGCNPSSYVVFVSVHKYISWIQQNVPDGELKYILCRVLNLESHFFS